MACTGASEHLLACPQVCFSASQPFVPIIKGGVPSPATIMWAGDVNVGSGAFDISKVKTAFVGAATALTYGISRQKLMSFRSLEKLQAQREALTVRCRYNCPCSGVPERSSGIVSATTWHPIAWLDSSASVVLLSSFTAVGREEENPQCQCGHGARRPLENVAWLGFGPGKACPKNLECMLAEVHQCMWRHQRIHMRNRGLEPSCDAPTLALDPQPSPHTSTLTLSALSPRVHACHRRQSMRRRPRS